MATEVYTISGSKDGTPRVNQPVSRNPKLPIDLETVKKLLPGIVLVIILIATLASTASTKNSLSKEMRELFEATGKTSFETSDGFKGLVDRINNAIHEFTEKFIHEVKPEVNQLIDDTTDRLSTVLEHELNETRVGCYSYVRKCWLKLNKCAEDGCYKGKYKKTVGDKECKDTCQVGVMPEKRPACETDNGKAYCFEFCTD